MTDPATPLTVPKVHLSAGIENRLARLVLAEPLLLSVVPSDDLRDVFAPYELASVAAEKARDLPVEPSLVDTIKEALRDGIAPDPAALVERVRLTNDDPRGKVVDALDFAKAGAAQDIVNLIDAYRDTYYEALSTNLGDVLDRATPVAGKLSGIDSAEVAIAGSRSADWSALQALTAEYALNRSLHRSLLMTEVEGESDDYRLIGLLRQQFGGLLTVWPDAYLNPKNDVQNAQMNNRVLNAPFDVYNPASPLHLLYVVRHRDTVRPIVGTGGTFLEIYPVTPRDAHPALAPVV